MIPLLFAAALIQPAVPFTTLDRGAMSAIDRPRQVVVRTQGDWETLWKEHAPARPVPKVDFTRQMVIAVFAGTRPTAGYDVAIKAIRAEGDGLVVDCVLAEPGKDMMVAQVITAPYDIVATERREGTVRFATTNRRGK